MSTQEQWSDVYDIAEQIYKSDQPKKRTELDLYSQIVCARYDTVFSYDPYTDEYSFRNQNLQFKDPVPPKVRRIAEIDLDCIKANTLEANLDTPSYMSMSPVFAVAPSTILLFSLRHPKNPGLQQALKKVSEEMSSRPTVMDVQPGSEFIYKHKDGQCYRVIILREIDVNSPIDAERKYDVAFLDVCQVISLKLKHLYMPLVSVSLEHYPCALFAARIRGIGSIRSGYLKTWDEEIENTYKTKKKIGLNTIVYKTERSEGRILVDFPSFKGVELPESAYLMTVQGHSSLTDKDPKGYSYQQIQDRILSPLEYEHSDDEHTDPPGLDDLEDLTDVSLNPTVANSTCPLGAASIDNFFKQHITSVSSIKEEPKVEKEISKSLGFGTQRPALFGRQNQLPPAANRQRTPSAIQSENVELCDEMSISSFRSTRNNTPLPTFDEQTSGDRTPTKQTTNKYEYESDGWDSPPKPPALIKPRQTFGGSEKPFERPLSRSVSDVNTPSFRSVSKVEEEKTTSKSSGFANPPNFPKAPVPLMSVQVPLMSIQVPEEHRIAVEKEKKTARDLRTSSFIQPDQKFGEDLSGHLDAPVVPKTPIPREDVVETPIIRRGVFPLKDDVPFGLPPNDDGMTPIIASENDVDGVISKEQLLALQESLKISTATPPPIPKVRRNGSSVGGSATKSFPTLEIKDDVFETPEDRNTPTTPGRRQPNPFQPPSSETSENSRLMTDAQDCFNDFSDADEISDDVWNKSSTLEDIHVEEKEEIPLEIPVDDSEVIPLETPKIPAEIPKEIPLEIPKEIPQELPKQIPSETPKPSSLETREQIPLVTPKPSTLELPPQIPSEILKEIPLEIRKEKNLEEKELKVIPTEILPEEHPLEIVVPKNQETPKEHPPPTDKVDEVEEKTLTNEPENKEDDGSVKIDEIEGLSVKSICSSDERDIQDPETRAEIVDEFDEVPEALKILADALIDAIQEAIFTKNRQAFNADLFVLEGIALRSSGFLETNFWKSKIAVAKSMENAFD